jgi:hypothetical protein
LALLRPGVCITAWAQYLLDNFTTVSEAVSEVRKESFRVVAVEAPNGAKGTVQMAISEPTGDSAIFEYVQGKLVIHHAREYQVMTNSPIYEKQLAINEYWKEFDGAVMLPDSCPPGCFFGIVGRMSRHLLFIRFSISKIMRHMSSWRAASSRLADVHHAQPLARR